MIEELINSVSNWEYGILTAVIITALFMYAIKEFYEKTKKFNALSVIIAIVLCVLLSFQMNHLISAIQVSHATSVANDILGAVSPTLRKYVPSSYHNVGWYIFRRILWSVIFLTIAGVTIVSTMDKQRRRDGRRPEGIHSGMRYQTTSQSRRRR